MLDELFSEIPSAMCDFSEWRLVWCARLEGDVPSHVLEAHAMQATVKHLARTISNHTREHLLLGDSMLAVLASDKGRSSDPRMNRSLRHIAAHVLATGIRIRVRWIPSERNPSDFGSRAFASNVKSIPVDCRHLRFPNLSASAFREAVGDGKREEETGRHAAGQQSSTRTCVGEGRQPGRVQSSLW